MECIPVGWGDAAVSAGREIRVIRRWIKNYRLIAGELYEALVNEAKERELATRRKFEMFVPGNMGAPSEAIMDTPWGLTWNTA